jgi:hypothetical protein
VEENKVFKGFRDDQIGIGNEGNPSGVNEPGLYFDPESEKELTVSHNAAADALVRMGWVRVQFDAEGNRLATTFGRRPEDSPEVLKLRAELAAAQRELENKNSPKPVGTPKAPKKAKDLTKKEDK